MRIEKIRCYGGDFNTFRSGKKGVLSSLWIQFGILDIFLDIISFKTSLNS